MREVCVLLCVLCFGTAHKSQHREDKRQGVNKDNLCVKVKAEKATNSCP